MSKTPTFAPADPSKMTAETTVTYRVDGFGPVIFDHASRTYYRVTRIEVARTTFPNDEEAYERVDVYGKRLTAKGVPKVGAYEGLLHGLNVSTVDETLLKKVAGLILTSRT